MTAARFTLPLLLAVLSSLPVAAQPNRRVYEHGQFPSDCRLQDPKDLNGHFPYEVPADQAAWEARAEALKQRILVATGLWPLPDKTPLNAVIHGKVQREGFTVEKVYFESLPNHFVTGLLFRPDDGQTAAAVQGSRPAVLCPHGHGGRLQDHGPQQILKLIASGDEEFADSGRFPKIARCAHLARMGCVVLIFDMLGYADSQQISMEVAHRLKLRRPDLEGKEKWGLFSAQADLRAQNVMGIQTWNAIRCLDFLEQLPDVDPKRIGVTGGSGGGTQTILLCAIDPRPIVAFPNGMVSTSMQGGCTCENCNLLRIGTGNVELAALFAPKPQGMTAADDWTRAMMNDGYPQLQQIYEMLGAKENVICHDLLQFQHNYNWVTRAKMYQWFRTHLGLFESTSLEEIDFEALTASEQAVWNDQHPQPAGGIDYELSLTQQLTEISTKTLAGIAPRDQQSLQQFREIVGGVYQTLIHRSLPQHQSIERTKVYKQAHAGYWYFEDKLRLAAEQEEFPVISLFPMHIKWNGDVVIWIDGQGKAGLFAESGQLRAEVARLVDRGAAVVSPDLFLQGEFLSDAEPVRQQRVVSNPREIASYTYAYNDSLLVQRVHDIMTVVAWVKEDEHAPQRIHLIGTGGTGPIVAAARATLGDVVNKAAVLTDGFRFENITDYRDPDFVAGSVKYGDLPALLALSAPHPLWIAGEQGQVPEWVAAAYRATGKPQNVISFESLDDVDAAVTWLLQD